MKMLNPNVSGINAVKRRRAFIEFSTRVILFALFFFSEHTEPFFRVVQPEELWLYRNPMTLSIVSSLSLYIISIISLGAVMVGTYWGTRDTKRVLRSMCVPTLALPLNGILTNIIKIVVGRLRPDYLNRCYGDSYLKVTELSQPCTGVRYLIMDGRRSFPSGHSSMAFTVFGFIFLYLSAQLGVFTSRGRGQSWRLILSLLPLLIATLIALSRTCDYHHHWQDVTVGSVIGFSVVLLVYRQYFPSIFELEGDKPYHLEKSASPRKRSFSVNKEASLALTPPSTVKTV